MKTEAPHFCLGMGAATGMTRKNVVLSKFGGYKIKPINFIRPTINLVLPN